MLLENKTGLGTTQRMYEAKQFVTLFVFQAISYSPILSIGLTQSNHLPKASSLRVAMLLRKIALAKLCQNLDIFNIHYF